MKYTEMKAIHRAEWDAFPIEFAFNTMQFEDGLKRLGVTKEGIRSTAGAGFIRETDVDDYFGLCIRQRKERQAALKDDEFLLEAMEYELANHEYCVTQDPGPALDAVGVSLDDERVRNLYRIARAKYNKKYYGQSEG